MSKTQPRRHRARSAKARSTDHYQVGYGRPPRAHQFEPGRSGNPKGRPKGAKNEDTILREIMNRSIEIREGGRPRKISVLAAILLKFAENALRGDPKSATFLLNRYGVAERDAPPSDGMDQNDRELLDSYIRDLKSTIKGKR